MPAFNWVVSVLRSGLCLGEELGKKALWYDHHRPCSPSGRKTSDVQRAEVDETGSPHPASWVPRAPPRIPPGRRRHSCSCRRGVSPSVGLLPETRPFTEGSARPARGSPRPLAVLAGVPRAAPLHWFNSAGPAPLPVELAKVPSSPPAPPASLPPSRLVPHRCPVSGEQAHLRDSFPVSRGTQPGTGGYGSRGLVA